MFRLYQSLNAALACFGGGVTLILDRERKPGHFGAQPSGYRCDLNKKKMTRQHILGRKRHDMTIFDVGAPDGELTSNGDRSGRI
ncbi:MAG: hypothetical protein H6926_06170 [Chromatiales bacterium]|nr:hypothetical protein [Chromatiales bacterium]